jgi:hypothetical protein
MTDTATLLEQTGTAPQAVLVDAVDALHDCEKASTACAMAMITGGGMAEEVHRALDCADVCAAAVRVLSRGAPSDPRVVGAVVEAAAVACEAAAEACGRHADHHPHCRTHAAGARACAEALRALQRSA